MASSDYSLPSPNPFPSLAMIPYCANPERMAIPKETIAKSSKSSHLSARIDEMRLKISKEAIKPNLFLPLNEAYRTCLYPLALLPFDQKVLRTIHGYVDEKWTKSFYASIPEIINPQLSLQQSLDLKDPHVLSKKSPAPGLFGKVSFVRFIRDKSPGRLFAVKEPVLPRVQGDARGALWAYETNLRIAEQVGDHPNFMKVAGIFIKNGNPDFTPYLILELIEGKELYVFLKEENVSLADKQSLFRQFINAMVILLEKRIFPVDIKSRNLLVTQDKILKFIDFDGWQFAKDPFNLASRLCCEIQLFAKKLFCLSLSMNDADFPSYDLDHDDISGSFDAYLKRALDWFLRYNALQAEDDRDQSSYVLTISAPVKI